MQGFSVHKLNEQLVVSLYPLPGFSKMGSCVVRDNTGTKSGLVTVYYTGSFFTQQESLADFEPVRKAVLKLAQNYAIKTGLGVATTRFNPTVALRERAERLQPCRLPQELHHHAVLH